MLLHDLLTDAAKHVPDNIAVAAGGSCISYIELDNASTRLADLLLSGERNNGGHIAILLDKSIEAIIAIFGILKSGSAYVPLDLSAPASRQEYILKDADIKTVITCERIWNTPNSVLKGYPYERAILIGHDCKIDLGNYNGTVNIFDWKKNGFPMDEHEVNISEEDPAYILYTSGSTGFPKGVILSHGNAMCFIQWAHAYFNIKPADVLSSHAPFYFDLSIFDIFVSIKAGAKLCLVSKGVSSFPLSLGKFIEENNITTWYSVPSVLVNLLLHGGLEARSLDSLARILYAGDVFPVKYLRQLRAKLPHVRFYNLYGPTETNVITYYEITEKPAEMEDEIPIGHACPYTDIRVIDENGEIAGVGQKGELVVRGASLMKGYLGKKEWTEKVIRPTGIPALEDNRYYFTGDVVKVLAEDKYRFVGRKDHMVKVMGFRVELEEIESALLKHEQIQECIVKYIPGDNTGKGKLKAYIVNHGILEESEIVRFLKKSLPDYMIPQEYETGGLLEKNSRGKTIR